MEWHEFNASEPFRPPGPGTGPPPPDGGGGERAGGGTGAAGGGDAGRVRAEYLPAYLISGVLLLVMAAAVIAWVVRGLTTTGTSPARFAGAFFSDSVPARIPPEALSAHEWALAVALLTVAAGLLCGRRLARGGALLLGALLLAAALRQAAGALDDDYRLVFSTPGAGGWMAATYAAAGLVGLVVLLLLLPAAEGGPARGFDPYGPARRDPRRTWAGALTLVVAALTVAWIADTQDRLVRNADAFTWGDYARGLVDPAAPGAGFWGADGHFYAAAFALALVTSGVLLLTDRPAGRGLTLTALAVSGYLLLRDAAAIDYENLHYYLRETRGVLWMLTVFGCLALIALAAVLLLPARRTTDHAAAPDWYPGDGFPAARGRSGGAAGGGADDSWPGF